MSMQPQTARRLDQAAPAEVPVTEADESGRFVSEDEYWQRFYLDADRPYEWNNGRLEEKPVPDHATTLVYLWFVELLRHYLRDHLGFFSLSPAGLYQPITPVNGVIGSRILPGFQFRIEDLQRQPGPEQMLDDPVYPFVLPSWREADRRAAAAEAEARAEAERAKVEAQRAEDAEQREASQAQRAEAAERELARLRAQGAAH